jgi:hypothetical protein
VAEAKRTESPNKQLAKANCNGLVIEKTESPNKTVG